VEGSIIRSPLMLAGKRKLAGSSDFQPATPNPAPAAIPPVDVAAQRAADLLEQARHSVLAQIKSEAQAARDLGRQRGLQEGRAAGEAESRQAYAAELTRVRSLAGKLSDALATGIGGVEDLAVAIAFEAVCKILGEAAISADGVRAQIKQAAAHAKTNERLVVRLHNADLDALRTAGALDAILAADTTVSWVADSSIELGGCVVETAGGVLDARLETQIDRMRTALLAARQTL
jgi:flagellar assembly protein FliH